MSAEVVCPTCGDKREYCFDDMNEQDGEYELECENCGEPIDVINCWVREVYVVGKICHFCDRYEDKCICDRWWEKKND